MVHAAQESDCVEAGLFLVGLGYVCSVVFWRGGEDGWFWQVDETSDGGSDERFDDRPDGSALGWEVDLWWCGWCVLYGGWLCEME
jgi:hypothetical protein